MFVVDPPWAPKEWSKLSKCLICVWSLVVLASVFMSSICFWWDMYCHQLPTSLERESQKAALWSRLQLFRLSRQLFYQNFLLLIIFVFLPRYSEKKSCEGKGCWEKARLSERPLFGRDCNFLLKSFLLSRDTIVSSVTQTKINNPNTSSFKAF